MAEQGMRPGSAEGPRDGRGGMSDTIGLRRIGRWTAKGMVSNMRCRKSVGRFLAGLLMACMAVGLLPSAAFAADGGEALPDDGRETISAVVDKDGVVEQDEGVSLYWTDGGALMAVLDMASGDTEPDGDEAGIAPMALGTVYYKGTVTWEVYGDATLVLRPTNGESGTLEGGYTTSKTTPWYTHRNSISSVEIQGKVVVPAGTSALFYNLQWITSITGLENLDVSGATSLAQMFKGCKSLTSLDLSSWKTGNVTSMNQMFEGCAKLTSLDSIIKWDTNFIHCSHI